MSEAGGRTAQPTEDSAIPDAATRNRVREARIPERRPGLPSYLQPTGGLTCPGCWTADRLAEVVPPRPPHQGYYQCRDCNWQGSGSEVAPEPRTPGEERSALDRQIQQCRREDERRGEKGGGGRSGKSRKGDDKLRTGTLRRSMDDSLVWSMSRSTNPLNNVVKATGVQSTAEELRQAVGEWLAEHGEAK